MEKVEYWDIYDKNKQRTGRKMKRNDWCLKDDEYHLTVLGVVAHKDGRFLITKRVMTKNWAPGWWEVSGGAAMAGEESKEAVLREVKEETGLDVSNWGGGYQFTYHRENPGKAIIILWMYINLSENFPKRMYTHRKPRRMGLCLRPKKRSKHLQKKACSFIMIVLKRCFKGV